MWSSECTGYVTRGTRHAGVKHDLCPIPEICHCRCHLPKVNLSDWGKLRLLESRKLDATMRWKVQCQRCGIAYEFKSKWGPSNVAMHLFDEGWGVGKSTPKGRNAWVCRLHVDKGAEPDGKHP